jgi:hypothetical protein
MFYTCYFIISCNKRAVGYGLCNISYCGMGTTSQYHAKCRGDVCVTVVLSSLTVMFCKLKISNYGQFPNNHFRISDCAENCFAILAYTQHLSTISIDYLELSTVVKLRNRIKNWGCPDRPGHCMSKIWWCPDTLDIEEFTPLICSD